MALTDLLIAFVLSAAPVAELRGGLPYALARGAPPVVAFGVSVLGNLAVVPVLAVALEFLSRTARRSPRLRRVLDRIASPQAWKHRVVRRLGPAALILLVAVPLPGTGAWTASLVAHVLGMPRRVTIPLIGVGVLIAGVVVLLASLGIITLLGVTR
ncbi:MAG: small multi-drug export protein [Candidatus Bipolaricaulota bacterium]|nr:MAG: small multi-drug export protein [Candidatus Bipolaricaulota bacterium]